MGNNTTFWSEVLTKGIQNIWLFTKAEFKVIGVVIVLMIMGFDFIGISTGLAILLAIVISLIDLIPVIGSGIVFIPWVLYEFITKDPSQAWGLLAIYLIITIAKQLLEPYFLGKDLELPFWLPITITIGCTIIFNVFGIVVAAVIIPFIAAYKQVSQKYRIR